MAKQTQEQLFPTTGKKILFGRDIFKKGQNYTVRYGHKYAEERGISLGDMFALEDTAGNHIAQGIITHIITCRMRDIPNEVFKNEHDPDCHNPICLFDEMVQVYPNKDITRETAVTCLGFTLLG